MIGQICLSKVWELFFLFPLCVIHDTYIHSLVKWELLVKKGWYHMLKLPPSPLQSIDFFVAVVISLYVHHTTMAEIN